MGCGCKSLTSGMNDRIGTVSQLNDRMGAVNSSGIQFDLKGAALGGVIAVGASFFMNNNIDPIWAGVGVLVGGVVLPSLYN